MSSAKLATRYAKSLIDLSVEKGQLEEVYQDIQSLDKATDNRDLYLLLKSPIVNTSKKSAILKTLFDGKLNDITSSFINIIVNKRRESFLPDIVDSFIEQYKSRKHIASATLVTATPVNDALLEKVRAIVKAQTGEETVNLDTSVDESLIGGFILKFGDKLYDSSISHKLEKLKKGFSKNKYVREY